VRARSGYNQTYPVYDRNNKQTGWRGRAEIRLESKDVQAMGDLIGRLQASMQLGGVRFSVSPELRRQVENELMIEAVAAFRARADIARQALNGGSYKIRRISLNTGGFAPPPVPVARAMAPAAADTVVAPNFEAGWTTVQVGASGTIEVE
jgi:predicted secreted protein